MAEPRKKKSTPSVRLKSAAKKMRAAGIRVGTKWSNTQISGRWKRYKASKRKRGVSVSMIGKQRRLKGGGTATATATKKPLTARAKYTAAKAAKVTAFKPKVRKKRA